ncbi:MAG: class I SAM-dependent methyltransferase, partial [Mesorhizobium sp.]|nr:class I SAM-dependent methyltransferase [Mesorhizobium sp.]
FTICVMHHVPATQWQQFSSEMRRILKPGGLAVVFEHNPFNPLTRRIVTDCVFDRNAVLLRPAKTKELLSGAGFSDVTARHILTIPAANRLLRTVDRAFSLLPVGAQYYVKATA